MEFSYESRYFNLYKLIMNKFYNFKPTKHILYNSFVLSLLSITFVWLFTNLFYGWVDDFWVNLGLKGQIISKPFSNFDEFYFLIGYMLKKMYLVNPMINWMGYFSLFTLFLLMSNFYLFFLTLGKKFNIKWIPSILISFLLFAIFLYENIYLFNFTRVSVLLIGFSALNLIVATVNNTKNHFLYTLLFFSFFLGIYYRQTSIALLLPLLLVLVLLWVKKSKYLFLTILFSFTIIPYIFFLINFNNNYNDNVVEIIQILNNSKHPDISIMNSDANTAKAFAMFTWFFGDFNSFDASFLSQLPEKIGFLNKIKILINESRYLYPEGYCTNLNWFWKSIALFILSVILLFSDLFLTEKKKYPYLHLGFFISMYLILFSISIIYKMEDRALNPVFLVVLSTQIFLLSFNCNKYKFNKYLKITFVSLLVICSIYKLNVYKEISNTKTKEIIAKKMAIKKLDSKYKDKTIVTDMFSMTLFHGFLLENTVIPANNTYISYRELWSYFSDDTYAMLKDDYSGETALSFYKYLYKEKCKDVLFLQVNFRKDMLEYYFKNVYCEDLKFSKIEDIYGDYSFTWSKMYIGLYQFDTSFNSENCGIVLNDL
jgi:hypothetical protein